MGVRLVEPRQRASFIETVWRLLRGERCAQAIAREVPGIGLELVITIDGELRWAQLYRGGIGRGMAAAEKRQALLDTGWVDAPSRDFPPFGAVPWNTLAGRMRPDTDWPFRSLNGKRPARKL